MPFEDDEYLNSSDWVGIDDENTLSRWQVAPMSTIDFDGVESHVMLTMENVAGEVRDFLMSPLSALNLAHDLLSIYLDKGELPLP